MNHDIIKTGAHTKYSVKLDPRHAGNQYKQFERVNDVNIARFLLKLLKYCIEINVIIIDKKAIIIDPELIDNELINIIMTSPGFL